MLLEVVDLRKGFLGDELFAGVTFKIDRREKVALVGRNGVGKSTLVKILIGEVDPDQGSLRWARGTSVGYLRQHAQLDPARTVFEEAESAQAHLRELQDRLRELEAKLEDQPSEDDLEEFARIHEHLEASGGYAIDRDLKSVLARMGFLEADYGKPVGALSGGETTRLMLAKLLIEEPDLLILDEPTNHLDLEATEWLEGWIRGYGGSVLAISHDRTFLNNIAERVLDMRFGEVRSYQGPYDRFIELREEDDARLADQVEKQQVQMAKLDDYVRRFMNSQRTAQARGRLKQLEKLRATALQAPSEDKGLAVSFGKVSRSGDIVIESKGLAMAFGERRLFTNLDWTVRWSERWGVIGGNGVGKSTLARIILKQFEPVAGTARLGANVKAGYFSQDAGDLDPKRTPVQVLNGEFGLTEERARDFLGRFLLSGDDSIRPIGSLSGGERNKLALARLILSEPNLLILDEPTNHLDIDSREALAEVLSDFKGTLVLISHDRWLLENVTDHTLEIRRDGATQFPGHYGEFRRSKPTAAGNARRVVQPSGSASNGMTPRELSKEIDRVNKLVSSAEANVALKEKELRELELLMSDPTQVEDIRGLSIRHAETQAQLDHATQEWFKLSMQLEELHEQRGTKL